MALDKVGQWGDDFALLDLPFVDGDSIPDGLP
jgi:hypothetical protein